MFSRYFAFGLILLLGFRNKQQHYNKLLFLFASTLAASFLFYLITNTGDLDDDRRLLQNVSGMVAGSNDRSSGFPLNALLFP